MASKIIREKRRAARMRAVEKEKQAEELLDQAGEEESVVEEPETVSKEYMGELSMIPVQPTSFEELDAVKLAREQAEHVRELTWDVQDLVYNITSHPMMTSEEKGRAISKVGNDFGERVSEVSNDMLEKSIDTDLLELEVLIAKDNRHSTLLERAADFVSKAKLTTQAENKLSDDDFALVYEDGDKKVRKYPIHDKAHVRSALSRSAQMMKQGGQAAVDAKKALPKIRAAAKKMGIGQMEKSSSAVLVEKDLAGNWRAVMWPSNNFKDLDGEIISEAAHVEYVDWVNKNMDLAPVTVHWHNPFTVREHPVDFVGYDQGFLMLSAPLEEEEAIALLKAQLKYDLGMSHGSFALERDPVNKNVITKYRMVEASDLPIQNAANPFTDFDVISKEAQMDTEKMREYLSTMYPPEKVEAFMEKNGLKQKALREAGVEEKAKKDTEVETATAATSDTPAPAPKLDMDAILKAVRADIDVEGLNELLSKASEAMEKVPVLEAVIKELSAAKEDELAQMISPVASTSFIWHKSRATESTKNVVDEDNEADAKLKKSAPEVPWLNQVTGTTPLQ